MSAQGTNEPFGSALDGSARVEFIFKASALWADAFIESRCHGQEMLCLPYAGFFFILAFLANLCFIGISLHYADIF